MKKDKLPEIYNISAGGIEAKVTIDKKKDENILTYSIQVPGIDVATAAFLEDIKSNLLKKITISSQEALDIKMAQQLNEKFSKLAKQMMKEQMPHLSPQKLDFISGKLVQEMLGLGNIEFLLNDDLIEEICVNSSQTPVWVYHRHYGWIKSNLFIDTEHQIWNYSSSIARRVGRQINTQSPFLDAYLPTGDRVNATLIPISAFGNTITIRKFARKPWTITDYMKSNTINSEVAALLWLAIQYESNVIISGGTGAGKTSLLNVLCAFTPQNNRIVSIEQTREITLPKYLQWVPMAVRQATSEGKGGIDMLDLMVNSLRQRPDRIIVGEIRRAEEAQVLFEAMHTGHAVYATLHAETASETLRRLINPPISIPAVMMESLHLVVTMYRDRRSGIRRIYEVAELLPTEREGMKPNVLYRWRASRDKIMENEKSVRLLETIRTYSNMDTYEITKDLEEKKAVLDYLVKKDINTVDGVGDLISKYYDDKEAILKLVGSK